MRRLLLGLIGPSPEGAALEGLSDRDWQLVDRMAAQHRLQPLLHARIERGNLSLAPPAPVREGWRTAYRESALRALALRKEALDIHARLAAAGIAAVALKGAYAAWHLYPAPAERPMRDLDFLLPSGRALEAFELLCAQGFRQEELAARPAAQVVATDKHLPPLLSPHGTRVELHMRLWERPESLGRVMPPDESAAMLARAAPVCDDDPLVYLAPEDMLVHFVIHGACSNRLDAGPLVLVDLDHLLAGQAIDWPAFWDRAGRGGYARGAALLLHLADRWRRPGLLRLSQCPVAVDEALLDAAPDLLLQDPAQRKQIGLLSELAGRRAGEAATGPFATLAGRLRGRDRGRYGEVADAAGPAREEGLLQWLIRRLGEGAGGLMRRDVRIAARESARLGQWLEGDDPDHDRPS